MEQHLDEYMNQFLKARHDQAWQLIKAYWQSDQRYPAYMFFTVVAFMTISVVGLDVAFNYWYYYFYSVVQAYDQHGLIRLLVVFFVLAIFYIAFTVYRYYVSKLFGLRLRCWLTEQFIGRWLQKRRYYFIENFDAKTENPYQRMQEDVGSLINYSIDVSMGLIGAISTFVFLLYILWELSDNLTLKLGSLGTYNISSYLVWLGILYAIVGTFFTLKFGRPLVALSSDRQRHEAGQKLLLWVSAGYNQTALILPLLVALPNYFDNFFLLVCLVQSIRAFSSYQKSFSYIWFGKKSEWC